MLCPLKLREVASETTFQLSQGTHPAVDNAVIKGGIKDLNEDYLTLLGMLFFFDQTWNTDCEMTDS